MLDYLPVEVEGHGLGSLCRSFSGEWVSCTSDATSGMMMYIPIIASNVFALTTWSHLESGLERVISTTHSVISESEYCGHQPGAPSTIRQRCRIFNFALHRGHMWHLALGLDAQFPCSMCEPPAEDERQEPLITRCLDGSMYSRLITDSETTSRVKLPSCWARCAWTHITYGQPGSSDRRSVGLVESVASPTTLPFSHTCLRVG